MAAAASVCSGAGGVLRATQFLCLTLCLVCVVSSLTPSERKEKIKDISKKLRELEYQLESSSSDFASQYKEKQEGFLESARDNEASADAARRAMGETDPSDRSTHWTKYKTHQAEVEKSNMCLGALENIKGQRERLREKLQFLRGLVAILEMENTEEL